ncbi:hypothetical protein MRB53_028545 [Persea americana]|uniref:Uncharacterized protein n=1 Tax=Persea americana TaxID=3435 RepID=A0ACC2KG81_PERAE|nr:hypothetical protein MRB53_028545 [Persea americana]
MMAQFISKVDSKLQDHDNALKSQENELKSQGIAIRNIERTMGQLANMMTERAQDALEQMPNYVEFLKDIISRKRKLVDFETVMLTKECTAILQNKLPQKLKDPGSFTIPCTIGLGEVKPATVSLQLADRSIKGPRGIIEDVLVKVDKFIFPADFVVLDMEEDKETPLILGRPFLATGRTLIDVQQGKLILRVQDEEITFNVFEAVRHPEIAGTCFNIEVIDELVANAVEQSIPKDPIEACIVHSGTTNSESSVLSSSEHELEASPTIISKGVSGKADLSDNRNPQKPSIIEAPSLELKPLPSHLKYAYLNDSSLPVIISSSLTGLEEEKLLRVLRAHKQALGWTIADIKVLFFSSGFLVVSLANCFPLFWLEDGSFLPVLSGERWKMIDEIYLIGTLPPPP